VEQRFCAATKENIPVALAGTVPSGAKAHRNNAILCRPEGLLHPDLLYPDLLYPDLLYLTCST
jgi:hypothetical protein